MTKFLWIGESEYCICGHHLTDHETSYWLFSLTEDPIVTCRGKGADRSTTAASITTVWKKTCHCDKFRPYRMLEDDDNNVNGEAFEKQKSIEEVKF